MLWNLDLFRGWFQVTPAEKKNNWKMDRFAWTDGLLAPDEQLMCQQEGVRLYDGDGKVW